MGEWKSKKQLRAADALGRLVTGGRATFFTLTTRDACDYETIRARWRFFRLRFMQDMKRRGNPAPLYVMNFEKHPGYLQKVVNKDTPEEWVLRSDGVSHGWHIHGVLNCRLDLFRYRRLLDSAGFGRVDVRPVTTVGVADYLTKHALKAYRGISRRERSRKGVERLRLVNTSRGLPRLSDYVAQSPFLEIARYQNALAVAAIKRAGQKVANALAVWKKAELAAMLYGTEYF